MTHDADCTLRILAHRACLRGPDPCRENTNDALRRAVAAGFDVEFDLQFAPNDARLILAHDPQPWSEARDALRFLGTVDAPQFHALNVKRLDSLPTILRVLTATSTQTNFLLFDFELTDDDLQACRAVMRSAADAGFSVAYRLSEREPYLDEYLRDPSVSAVWLDEFAAPWVTQETLARLTDRAIRTFYVSPDLHGTRDMDTLKPRWEQMVSWGVSAICTDFPLALRQFLHNGY